MMKIVKVNEYKPTLPAIFCSFRQCFPTKQLNFARETCVRCLLITFRQCFYFLDKRYGSLLYFSWSFPVVTLSHSWPSHSKSEFNKSESEVSQFTGYAFKVGGIKFFFSEGISGCLFVHFYCQFIKRLEVPHTSAFRQKKYYFYVVTSSWVWLSI